MHSTIARLVYRATTEADFQAQLAKDPSKTLQSSAHESYGESQAAILGALQHLTSVVPGPLSNCEKGRNYVWDGWFAPSGVGDSLVFSS